MSARYPPDLRVGAVNHSGGDGPTLGGKERRLGSQSLDRDTLVRLGMKEYIQEMLHLVRIRNISILE